ncbi:GDP-fucose synthetase [Raphidocelis subcapitata]|uniref:GDP-L-fucose synthase n=1 Tax=Raphidocelis subcapitata TaxID=307507 RepID=A0A2V0NX23_9CHLO|nr:GDP-fucose synthetase [Raphidocelis subcapitata]|eukprot:GBF92176.1 GDP-fucose synthetase [Raphidocelis subcapitata]
MAPVPRDAKVYVAGHQGLVGGAIWRALQGAGFTNLVGRSREELDLTDEAAVDAFYARERPDYVYVAAAKVGGILANDTYPADFLLDNLRIQTAVITGAHRAGVRKLLFLGSSCIYPKHAPQPMTEDCLLTGPLEPTNEWYAVAKIAGIKTCQALRRQHGFDAIAVMPTNLYGPGDNFHPTNSHVLPALIRRFVEAKESGAKEVTCWGTGRVYREFLHVDDLAAACVHLMDVYSDAGIVNIGTGTDVTIRELTEMVQAAVGWEGRIVWDSSKPDGTPRKLLDVSKLTALGWKAQVPLERGVAETVAWYLKNQGSSELRL